MLRAPGGRACDIGAGNGRHAFLLAVTGYRVLAIENDRAAATSLRNTARTYKLPIQVSHANVLEARLRGTFDFICVTNLLHHLSRRDAQRLVKRLRTATAPGGVHVVTVFTDRKPRQEVTTPFERGELRAMYDDWDILAYREWITRPLRFGGPVAVQFPYAAIIARRPRASSAGTR